LVGLRGDLVGINSAFIAVRKSNPGMGFAIPINMARSLVDQMLEFGDIRRGALGLTYDDFTSARSRDPAGAVVRAVAPRSAAERAGLKPGDLVTELGGNAGTRCRRSADQAGAAADRRSRGICCVVAGRHVDCARRNGGAAAGRTLQMMRVASTSRSARQARRLRSRSHIDGTQS
jgi:hypothetical protein